MMDNELEQRLSKIEPKITDKNFSQIKGVIKVGQELDEYIVTKELSEHFRGFFESYKKSIKTLRIDLLGKV